MCQKFQHLHGDEKVEIPQNWQLSKVFDLCTSQLWTMEHMEARFADMGKLSFLGLVNIDKFKTYKTFFPETEFSSLGKQ